MNLAGMVSDDWHALWLKTAEEKGHTLQRHDGNIDVFAGVSSTGHNGPLCTRCGWAVCMHCLADPDLIPACEAA